MPPEFPDIPQEVLDRFPSAKDWQARLDEFWTRSKQAIEQAQTQAANYANSRVTYSVDTFRIYAKNGIPQPMFAVDSTGVKLGDTLVISTVGRKVFIGEGNYADAQTPFYIDTLGRFSLGANLTWDPDTATLNVTGVITATSGTIGGFDIGADYIRDVADSFGLASTVTGGNDVRFWAGSTFAGRSTAPVVIRENGDSDFSVVNISGFLTSTAAGQFFQNTTASTAIKYLAIGNTGSSFFLGVASSTGSVGAAAYQSFLSTTDTKGFVLSVNLVKIAEFLSTGLFVTGVVDIIGTAASATASHLQLGSSTQSTIGANGAASALTANPLGYLSAYLGTTHIIIPYYNA